MAPHSALASSAVHACSARQNDEVHAYLKLLWYLQTAYLYHLAYERGQCPDECESFNFDDLTCLTQSCLLAALTKCFDFC
jgi:hypothetical protein